MTRTDPVPTPHVPDPQTQCDAELPAEGDMRPVGAAPGDMREIAASRGPRDTAAAATTPDRARRPRSPRSMQHVSFESALAAGLGTVLPTDALRSALATARGWQRR